MKKCKLSLATRKKWTIIINQCLKQEEYGNFANCKLCKESGVNDNYEITNKNRKYCITNCIFVKFLKADNFNFMASQYPCNDYTLQTYGQPIEDIKPQIIKAHLKEIKEWLK